MSTLDCLLLSIWHQCLESAKTLDLSRTGPEHFVLQEEDGVVHLPPRKVVTRCVQAVAPLVCSDRASLLPARGQPRLQAAGMAARFPPQGRRKPPISRGCGLEHPWDEKHLLLLPLFQLRAR